MKLLILAINCLLFLTAELNAQYVPSLSGYATEYATQCGPQGCCPPQYSQPRYSQPRQRQRPQPDGVFTPPVGSPGTPDFHPNCPGIPPNTPPLPPPPPVQTPPMQPPAPKPEPSPATQPAPDTKALDKLTTINQQILIAIEKQGGCKCEPVDLKPLTAKVDALALAVANIKVEQPKQEPAPDKSTAPIGPRRLYLRAVPIQ